MSQPPGTSAPSVTRATTSAMRWALLAASVPAVLAGLALFFTPAKAEQDFAWTIAVPITATFLGAAYLAAVFLPLVSAAEREWARARVAVPVVLVFATLGLVASLVHLDILKFDGPTTLARVSSWLWLIPYLVFPPLLLLLLARQVRVPGGDPARRAPIPGWARAALGVQAVVLLVLGVILFVAPQATRDAAWPWQLTPLTGKIIGAWLVALGLGAALVIRENDWTRTRAAALSYGLFGALQIVALLRYTEAVDWGGSRVWLYVGFLITMLVMGSYGLLGAIRSREPRIRFGNP